MTAGNAVFNMPDYESLGLRLHEEFITEAEERVLLDHIATIVGPYRPDKPERNGIYRWGSKVLYSSDIVSAAIPAKYEKLCLRLVEQNFVAHQPDSITINEYYPGQTIKPHIDHIDGGDVITVLSLASPATMVLSHSTRAFELELPPRSIVQLRDAMRYTWKHAIRPVPALRYSIVFRCSQDCKTH